MYMHGVDSWCWLHASVGSRTASLNTLSSSIWPESLIHLELEPWHVNHRRGGIHNWARTIRTVHDNGLFQLIGVHTCMVHPLSSQLSGGLLLYVCYNEWDFHYPALGGGGGEVHRDVGESTISSSGEDVLCIHQKWVKNCPCRLRWWMIT